MEEWRDIPGYEWYQASSLGRIRSLPRYQSISNRWGTTTTRIIKGRILKPYKGKSGYTTVSLGAGNRKEAHYFVALAFHGVPKCKMEVNHIDFNRANNAPSNLEWSTRSENRRHSLRDRRGNTVKLSVADIQQIRKLIEDGMPMTKIYLRFNVSYSTVKMIKRNKTWGWL